MKKTLLALIALGLCACETQEHHAAVMQRVRADTARRQASYGQLRTGYARPIYYDPVIFDDVQQRRVIEDQELAVRRQRDWDEIRQQERDAVQQSQFNDLQHQIQAQRDFPNLYP